MTRWLSLAVGGILSLTLGLVLAIVAFGVVILLGGNPREGGYCSEFGIGVGRDYVAQPEDGLIYVSTGLGGIPPQERCRLYAVDHSETSGPYLIGAMSEGQYLSSPAADLPHQVLKDETYPGTSEYVWIFAAFLFPVALWCLYALSRLKGRAATERSQRQRP
jgi:hypothetical protein